LGDCREKGLVKVRKGVREALEVVGGWVEGACKNFRKHMSLLLFYLTYISHSKQHNINGIFPLNRSKPKRTDNHIEILRKERKFSI
jgi:hypothetical protein